MTGADPREALARGRRRAAATSGRLVGGVLRRASVAVEDRSAADLAIAAILRDERCAGLEDPVAFVRFLRDAFEPTACLVEPVAGRDGDTPDGPALRFATLVGQLATAVPPLARPDAVRIALRADEVGALRDPFDRPGWAIDVGLHARIASSFARKGRILAATARFTRARHALEIGTAYGLSALFLAQELERRGGRLTTLERSHPQVDVARRVLEAEHPESVRLVGGVAADLEPELRDERYDLLFHDAEHSREAYVRDFEAFAGRLEEGAVVLYDDIRWEDPRREEPAETYAGWRAVAAHPRVRRAVEVDRAYGLLLLG